MVNYSDYEKYLIDEIASIKWNEYNGPECYVPKEIQTYLTKLIQLRDENQNLNIYNAVMYAIGNSHAGSYYPAMLKALPIIIDLANHSKHEIVRNCILEMLTDWYYSFGPELGTFNKITETELRKFVNTTIINFIKQANKIESKRNKILIKDLYNTMQEESLI